MGFSHSWVAVQNTDVGTVADSLGLEPFGVERLAHDVPDLGIAELPEGWLVVVQADPAAAFRAPLADITRLGPAIACSEDSARVEPRGYDVGVEAWRLVADSEAPDILSRVGEAPEAFDVFLDMAGEEIFCETPRAEVFEAYREVVLQTAWIASLGFRLSDPPAGLGWTELRPKV